MINGIKKGTNEKEYRSVLLDSASSLKDFSIDRKKYFKRYILNEYIEDEITQAIRTGNIVDCLLLEAEKFDDKFAMSAIASSPTGLMLEFTEALYRATKEATSEEGDMTKSFEDLSREAYTASGFKITYEAVIKKFIGSDAEIYYNEICEIRSKGLTVVTAQDVTNAENIVQELKVNPVTKKIVNLVDSKRYTIKNQLQVEGYSLKEHLFKSMMDKVIIDHQEKTISVYDLKCVWSVENFYEEYYLYRRAYIQAYLYYMAAIHLSLITPELNGYKVMPPKFIVCDSTNYFNPLIYELDSQDIVDACNGFVYKGRTYPGVDSIIEDLKWSLETNTWNISRKNYLSDGIVKLTE